MNIKSKIGCFPLALAACTKEGAQTRLIPCHLRVLPPPSDEIRYGLDWKWQQGGKAARLRSASAGRRRLSGGRGHADEIPEQQPVGVALDGRAFRAGPCDAPQGKICPGR